MIGAVLSSSAQAGESQVGMEDVSSCVDNTYAVRRTVAMDGIRVTSYDSSYSGLVQRIDAPGAADFESYAEAFIQERNALFSGDEIINIDAVNDQSMLDDSLSWIQNRYHFVLSTYRVNYFGLSRRKFSLFLNNKQQNDGVFLGVHGALDEMTAVVQGHRAFIESMLNGDKECVQKQNVEGDQQGLWR